MKQKMKVLSDEKGCLMPRAPGQLGEVSFGTAPAARTQITFEYTSRKSHSVEDGLTD